MSIVSKLIVPLVLLLTTQTAQAALTLNGTRFIYHQNDKSMEMRVKNNDQRDFGGQIWVDNLDQPTEKTFFAVYPSLFKLSPQSVQSVKFINISALPKNRESIFYINVQEIPPSSSVKNALTIAMNTKVKLFYRPNGLQQKREAAEKNIVVRQQANGFVLENTTPYYFAILQVKELTTLNKQITDRLAIFAPYSNIHLPYHHTAGNSLSSLTLLSINDHGGTDEYILPILTR